MPEIKDIDIDWISILTDDWKPKNGRVPIVKGENSRVKIIKADPIKGLLFAEVFYGNTEDKDKDKPSNAEVEKGCFEYMKKVTKGGALFDVNHNNKPLENVHLVENCVDRSGDNWSHKVTIDFSANEDLMKKAVDSGINGISPEGTVTRINKGEDDEGLFRKFLNFVGIKNIEKEIEPIKNIEKGENMENFNEFILTDEGLKALEDAGYIKKPVEVEKGTETPKETLVKEEPKAEPSEEVKVLKAEIAEMKVEMDKIKKARVTDPEETTPQGKDIDEMTGEELASFKETDPAGYKKALKEKAKTI